MHRDKEATQICEIGRPSWRQQRTISNTW